MAKISTYPSADVPLQLSDRLIGTEAFRPVPSPTPLATKNFSLGELLNLFSANFPAATLQAVLNAGNTATQNITLTGTISATLIKPINIEDTSGSQGLTFQVLSKGTSSINWVSMPVDTLQAVLNAGNTATQNITLIGDITSTKIIPGNIQDELGFIGTAGQFLSKTATGIRWVNTPAYATPTLGDVVAVGDTANQDIFINTLRLGKGTGTGANNTALGYLVLGVNSSGFANLGVGAFALAANTTANRNTAVGYAALYTNISGNLNVAVGGFSQYLSTTGIANVSLGYGTLQTNVIGNFNTALGYRALLNNKADKNTAIGAETMFVNQTGIFNTVVGQEALRASVAGSYNSILGNFAMLNAEASYVSALGRDACRFSSAGNLLTASESIFIGFNSKSLNTSSTNEIVIGANAVGEGDNTVTLGHTTITSTRLRGTVKGGSFVKDGGTALEYLMADGSVTTGGGAQDLNDVLTNGNVSQIDAKVGGIYLYNNNAPSGLGYPYITGNKNRFNFYNNANINLANIQQDSLVLIDSVVPTRQFEISKPAAIGANRVATFQDADGTIAYLSDITPSPLTTKGDLYTFDTAPARLPVGLNTQILIADSTQPTGLRWGSNSAPVPLGYYGQYFDYNDQNATINNVGVPMIFGTLDLSNGITVVSDGTNLTKITFANSGVYNLQFSTQFENLSNAPQDIFIWIRKNGTTTAFDVVGSTGYVGLEARKNPGDPYHTIVTWNFLLDILAGDFYQIVWATTDITNVGIRFNAGTVNFPSTASTLFTVTQQSGIMAGTGVTNVSAVMTNPSQTVVVTNPTTIPQITIDDTNFMYNKFMVNQYGYLLPSDVNLLWDSLRVGGTLLVTGTNTALSENPMGQQFTTATAVSSVTGFFGTNFGNTAFFGVNFTFDFSYRFRINTNNGAQRFFAGLSQMYGTATPTNIEPTAMINSIGVAKLQGSANLFFIWNDATGTASSLDLGSGFLGTDTASTYRIRIWKTSGIAAINLQLTKVVNSTGVTTTTSVLTITSDYNTGVNHHAAIWMGNNTAATGAVSFKNYGCELSKRNVINA